MEEIRQFRAGPWRFQKTFKTPLKDLNRFVSTFLASFPLEKNAFLVNYRRDQLHLLPR